MYTPAKRVRRSKSDLYSNCSNEDSEVVNRKNRRVGTEKSSTQHFQAQHVQPSYHGYNVKVGLRDSIYYQRQNYGKKYSDLSRK